MARPKKKELRNVELRIRITDKERVRLNREAAKAGKTLADYVRSKLGLAQEHYGTSEQPSD